MNLRDYSLRVLIMVFVLLVVTLAASTFNWVQTPDSYPFAQMLINDLFVTLLFCLAPFVAVSIAHTALVAHRARKAPEQGRIWSVAFGASLRRSWRANEHPDGHSSNHPKLGVTVVGRSRRVAVRASHWPQLGDETCRAQGLMTVHRFPKTDLQRSSVPQLATDQRLEAGARAQARF